MMIQRGRRPRSDFWDLQCYPAKTFHEKSRLLIYDSLLSHTHIVRKLTFLGVQKCRCVTIGYPRNKVIQSQSLKNGSILYEDSELRNEVTVSFPIEGIFQNIFAFQLLYTHRSLSLKGLVEKFNRALTVSVGDLECFSWIALYMYMYAYMYRISSFLTLKAKQKRAKRVCFLYHFSGLRHSLSERC